MNLLFDSLKSGTENVGLNFNIASKFSFYVFNWELYLNIINELIRDLGI